MANTVTKSATVGTAYGQKLEKPLTFFFSYDEILEEEEIPADETLTPEDILAYVNQRRYAASRAKAQNEVFEANGISKPKLLDTEEGRIATMAKVFASMGNSAVDSVKMARVALGLN
jgi:hypothetical protein